MTYRQTNHRIMVFGNRIGPGEGNHSIQVRAATCNNDAFPQSKIFSSKFVSCLIIVLAVVLLSILFLSMIAQGANGEYDVELDVASGHSSTDSAYPGDKVKFYLDAENKGSENDTYTITSGPLPDGWKISISPTNTSELSNGENDTIIIAVTIPDWANATDSIDFIITATSTEDPATSPANDSVLLTCDVEQVYNMSLALDKELLDIHPAFNDTTNLTLTNTGNGEDYFKIEITRVDGITVDINPTMTDEILRDEDSVIRLKFDVDGGEEPRTERFWINVTSLGAQEDEQEVIGSIEIEVKINSTFGVSLSRQSQTHSVSPTYNGSDIVSFQLSLTNDGTDMDSFDFEFMDDALTMKYKHWLTLPDRVEDLGAGLQTTVDFQLEVPPYHDDDKAFVNGAFKEITIRVYSVTAREKGVEVEGDSTDDCIFYVDINEYRRMSFIPIEPETITLSPGESGRINLTLTNLGNGIEQYSFIKDGWDDGGQHRNWYDFNQASAELYPLESLKSFIIVDPEDDTAPGEYDLFFHGKSEAAYETGHKNFTVIIPEVYRGEFVRGSQDSYNPGDTAELDVLVRNTGNVLTTFDLDFPEFPVGWEITNSYAPPNIQPDQSAQFLISIRIPDDENIPDPGFYSFSVPGEYWNGTDNVPISGEAFLNITIMEHNNVEIWSDSPVNGLKFSGLDPVELHYPLTIRNAGNMNGTFTILVPGDEFSGDRSDWQVFFGNETISNSTEFTVYLTIGNVANLDMFLIVDKKTDPGEYDLNVKARSEAEPARYSFANIEVNLYPVECGILLQKIGLNTPVVRPQDGTEVEYTFALKNIGESADIFTVQVETPVSFGPYKDWIIEFENKDGNRVEELEVPGDLPDMVSNRLAPNETVVISLYVTVDFHETLGAFNDIEVSVMSEIEHIVIEHMKFNLTTIKPNIYLSNDPGYFSIEPDQGLEEGDSLDINIRVFNNGTAETGEFWVFFYNGKYNSPVEAEGNYLSTEKVDNIKPDSYVHLHVTWDELPAGENDIFVYADKPIRTGPKKALIDGDYSPDGMILELDENDNYISIDASFREALLIEPEDESTYSVELRADITKFELNDKDVTIITLTVKNTGEKDDSYTLTLSGGYEGWNITIEAPDTIPLLAGAEYTCSLMIIEDSDPENGGGGNGGGGNGGGGGDGGNETDDLTRIEVTVTVGSTTRENVEDSVILIGELKMDDDETEMIPFGPPSMTVMAIGGAGVIFCFRRRRSLRAMEIPLPGPAIALVFEDLPEGHG